MLPTSVLLLYMGILPPQLSVGRVSQTAPVLELFWEFPYPTFVDYVVIYERRNDAPATQLTVMPVGDVQLTGSFRIFAGSPGTKYGYAIEVHSAEAIVVSNYDEFILAPRRPEGANVVETRTREMFIQWTYETACATCTYLVQYTETARTYGLGRMKQFGVSCPQLRFRTFRCSANIRNLTPGTLYTIDVYATSYGKRSHTAAEVRARTLPDPPQNVTVTMLTTRSISIAWLNGDGYRTHYYLHAYAHNIEEIGEVRGDVTHFTFHNLLAGTHYTIVIMSSANHTRGLGVVLEKTTFPTEPGTVDQLLIEPLHDPKQVRLRFLAPVWPNGVLVGYQVQFVGLRPGGENFCSSGLMKLPVSQTTVIIDQLKGGCNYTFLVQAENQVGLGPGTQASILTEVGVPAMPETVPPLPASTSIRTTGFVVTFDPTVFDDVNGEITHVVVIVSEAAAADQPEKGRPSSSKTRTWAEAMDNDVIPPYQISDPINISATVVTERRRRSSDPEVRVEMEIAIGTEECSRKEKTTYCNGPLVQGRSYVYRFRGISEGGYADTQFSLPVLLPTSPQGIIIGISTALFSLLVIVIILSIIVIVRKFRLDGRGRYLPANMKDVELTRVANNHHTITVSKQKYSRPVAISDFARDWYRMNSDCNYGYSEEYDVIRKVGRKMTTHSAVAAPNVSKNRYTNILPYDRTRVKLSGVDDEEGSDYINANYIPGFSSPREYIACQGPLPGTVDDSWKMIWEQNVTTVVMVTQLVEKGKVKCDQYWPDDHKPVLYGDVQVSMTQTIEENDWNIKEFIVQMRDQRRHVRHWNFLSWPDHGVPESSRALLAFIRRIRGTNPPSTAPIMVHCSAGVGRTGTFIILDRLMQHMDQYDFIDIMGLVCEMRTHRSFMVQTEQQYVFIHRCIMDVLEERNSTVVPTLSESLP